MLPFFPIRLLAIPIGVYLIVSAVRILMGVKNIEIFWNKISLNKSNKIKYAIPMLVIGIILIIDEFFWLEMNF